MKRCVVIKYLFILIVFSFLFLGCTKKTEPVGSRVEISLSTADSGEGLQLLEELIKEFEIINPGIRVKIEQISSQGYMTKILTRFVTGTAPDVVMITSLPENLPYYARKGVLMPLEQFINTDLEFNRGDFFSSALRIGSVNSKLYAMCKEGNALILFYNCNLFDKTGLKYPDDTWTWENYYQAARRLTQVSTKDRERVEIFGSSSLFSPELFYTMVRQHGGNICDSNGQPSFIGKEIVEALSFAERLSKERLSPRTADIADFNDINLFIAGKIAMMPAYPYLIRIFNENTKTFRYDVAPLPVIRGEYRIVATSASGYAISLKTNYPKQSWQLVKYLSGKEGQEVIAKTKYGVPLVKSVAYSDTYAPPPEHIRSVVNAMEYGEILPVFVGFEKAWIVIQGQLDLLMAGRHDAKSASIAMAEGIKQLQINE